MSTHAANVRVTDLSTNIWLFKKKVMTLLEDIDEIQRWPNDCLCNAIFAEYQAWQKIRSPACNRQGRRKRYVPGLSSSRTLHFQLNFNL